MTKYHIISECSCKNCTKKRAKCKLNMFIVLEKIRRYNQFMENIQNFYGRNEITDIPVKEYENLIYKPVIR